LKTALETIRRGDVYIAPTVVDGMVRTNQGPREPSPVLKERQLSNRELQIFTLIGQGRNTHEIATELQIAVSTVETYRERLKSKLNLASGPELMRYAFFWAMQSSEVTKFYEEQPGGHHSPTMDLR
jgi:DNA-binding NarL/FixJ family response regulator